MGPLPKVGLFDVIFLRNVLIYFDLPTKRRVVDNLLPFMKPGGFFFSGHSESLTGLVEGLQSIQPAIYKKSV
jgi:chemotaxis protein methyltransferase CheR